jgi:uncharacterized OB-fold protein
MTENSYPAEFEPFWRSVRNGVLSFPYCDDCRRFHWYPLKRCPHCQSDSVIWRSIEGHGRIFTWTVVHRAFDAAFADQLPYTVALIEFDDAPGVRLVSNIIDADSDDLAIGEPVEPVFPLAGDVLHESLVQTDQPRPLLVFRRRCG